jgi:hypothetical protein
VEYLRRTNATHDYGALAQIVQERTQTLKLLPSSTAAVVHLRLGDVADKHNVSYLWAHGNPVQNISAMQGAYGRVTYFEQYVKPKAFYVKVIEALPEHVKKVIIVGFTNHRHNGTSSPRELYGFIKSTDPRLVYICVCCGLVCKISKIVRTE